MTPADRVTLGEVDPLMAEMDGPRSCRAQSEVQDGMIGPFLCTRIPDHATTNPEHVAAGAVPGLDYVPVIAAWMPGGPLRILGVDAPLPDRMKARYGRG